jgi:uncharacterized protein
MNTALKDILISLAKREINNNDPSHDFEHALRVLKNAEMIARHEGGDLDVIIPAALFHDVIVYPKDSKNSHRSSDDSAKKTIKLLHKIKLSPKRKINQVAACIRDCSFLKGINHTTLEAKIVQDADWLEATGAISIMRTYSSTGQMKRPFYHAADPFCLKREPESTKYALDLFYSRLLIVEKKMYTSTAKCMARRRTKFLKIFLSELKSELSGKY